MSHIKYSFARGRVMVNRIVRETFNIQMFLCPFCSSTNVGLCLGPTLQCVCLSCEAEGPAVQNNNRDDRDVSAQFKAIQLWNHRGDKAP